MKNFNASLRCSSKSGSFSIFITLSDSLGLSPVSVGLSSGPGLLSVFSSGPGLLSGLVGPGGLLSGLVGPGGLLSGLVGPGGLLSGLVGPGGLPEAEPPFKYGIYIKYGL